MLKQTENQRTKLFKNLIISLLVIGSLALLVCACSSNKNNSANIAETSSSDITNVDYDFQTIMDNAIVDYPTSNEDWEYTIYTDTTGVYDKFVVLTEYIGSSAELEVPEAIDGYPVISIQDLFHDTTTTEEEQRISITSISLPSTLLEIGDEALWSGGFGFGYDKTVYNCDSIEKIVIPDSVQYIEGYAFTGEGWGTLKEITIPSSVKEIAADCGLEYRNENLIIYGEVGSAAAQFCAENDITFKVIE